MVHINWYINIVLQTLTICEHPPGNLLLSAMKFGGVFPPRAPRHILTRSCLHWEKIQEIKWKGGCRLWRMAYIGILFPFTPEFSFFPNRNIGPGVVFGPLTATKNSGPLWQKAMLNNEGDQVFSRLTHTHHYT